MVNDYFREKPGDPEWEKLEDMKTPFLLNFCQCKLSLGEFYPVIEHASTVLKREPGRYIMIETIKNSEYDQEIPQTKTADKPLAL